MTRIREDCVTQWRRYIFMSGEVTRDKVDILGIFLNEVWGQIGFGVQGAHSRGVSRCCWSRLMAVGADNELPQALAYSPRKCSSSSCELGSHAAPSGLYTIYQTLIWYSPKGPLLPLTAKTGWQNTHKKHQYSLSGLSLWNAVNQGCDGAVNQPKLFGDRF